MHCRSSSPLDDRTGRDKSLIAASPSICPSFQFPSCSQSLVQPRRPTISGGFERSEELELQFNGAIAGDEGVGEGGG